MRTGIGIVAIVAIGLIWSVAVMSELVPVASAEMRSAAVIKPSEAGRNC
jgi:Na+-transporting methylmalonyl-CoA/oxaloacetate decarboxylase gamma subunit